MAQAGLILDVRDIDTPGDPSVLHTGGLADGVSGFVDRTGQLWLSVPTALEGADYIESAQDNADANDALGTTLVMEVDVVQGTILHMFIDTRDPIGSLAPFSWMTLAGFGADWVDSGDLVLGGGGGGIDGVTFARLEHSKPTERGYLRISSATARRFVLRNQRHRCRAGSRASHALPLRPRPCRPCGSSVQTEALTLAA